MRACEVASVSNSEPVTAASVPPSHLHWKSMIPTLTWTPEGVRFIDQTKLPLEESYVLATTYEQVAEVIVTMVVRGAPAIGVSAAYGIALGAQQTKAATTAEFAPGVRADLRAAGRNAAHGGESVLGHRPHEAAFCRPAGGGRVDDRSEGEDSGRSPRDVRRRHCGVQGDGRLWRGASAGEGGVLTHCNAGALATCGYGTALGVIRSAVEQGKRIHVYADETRPFLQGARLTAWELMADGIPTTVICDNMAASLMRAGQDSRPSSWARTALPPTAISPTRSAPTTWPSLPKSTAFRFTARRPGPPSTWPARQATPFPSRSGRRSEVTHHGGKQLTPHGVGICNPAFDVTPARYVTAIFTERGVLRAPYAESLRAMELAAK